MFIKKPVFSAIQNIKINGISDKQSKYIIGVALYKKCIYIIDNTKKYKYEELNQLEPKIFNKTIDKVKIISGDYDEFISKEHFSKSLEIIKNQDNKSKLIIYL